MLTKLSFRLQFFVVAALVAVAAAAPSTPYSPRPAYHPAPAYTPVPAYHQPSYKEPAQPYQFDYAVNDHYSGAVFSQNENSDANNVNGYYSVNLPDGRVQTVKYVADQQGYGGYNAEVTYEGEARYDEYKPSYKPAPYKPASYAAPAYQPAYKPVYKPTYKPTYKPAYN